MKLRFIIQIGSSQGYHEVDVNDVIRIAGEYVITSTHIYKVISGSIDFIGCPPPLSAVEKSEYPWEHQP